ncbi:PREDICTED: uncharacterized protein LOC107349099 [Acropora digitifera]|uniref:uncharacterized protein LOC107349099 n=1 Tax=Acropora digitifera TaxID=70779 RepID=UPI00077B1B2C|nr:PREDICTED: uncharacterized protein LOC107349099 [Acropora digitifera]
MTVFQLFRFYVFLFVLKTYETKQTQGKGGKKNVVLCQPNHHQAAVVLYGNEGSGQSDAEKETLNALATNVETVTNLVKAQSEIIENLSRQVSGAAEGSEATEKFKQMFEKAAKHSRFIRQVSKQLNNTVKNVQELAGEWSKSRAKITKQLKGLEKESHENREDKEQIEERLMEKIEKLQEKLKMLQESQNYANAECTACKEVWPEGSYCILANGSCPKGFDSHRGHLRSLYLYSSHPQFVGDSKFGNSSMGCFGSYCGEFGNFIGALTLVTCCK